MRRFYMFKRTSNGLFYVQFCDPETGRRLSPRSLGTRDREEALLRVGEWSQSGIPSPANARRTIAQVATVEAALRAVRDAPLTADDALRLVRELRARGLVDLEARSAGGPASEPFGAWLVAFWDYDTSKYVAERLAHGQRATKRHCQDMQGRARETAEILGRELRLGDVKRAHLTELGLKLKAEGRAPATVNKTMSATTTALRWAAVNELIPTDPTRGLRGFSGAARKRGILEPGEVKALFSTPWADERARVACLVAATTGARLGEILALQRQDIGEDRLFVRHSYSIKDGLKSTKSGESREVPVLPAVRSALLALEGASPHPDSPERFVFAGRKPARPLDANRILLGMRKALVAMNGGTWGSDDPGQVAECKRILIEYMVRGVDFHSWRHLYAKTMSERLDARTVQIATGHKTGAMFEHYADHVLEDDLARLGIAAGEAFTNLIEREPAQRDD